MFVSARFRNGIASLSVILLTSSAWSAMPSNPVSDSNFMVLPGGKNLSSIAVKGVKLSLTKGKGGAFGSLQQNSYKALKAATQTDRNHKIQWALMDLDRHVVIAKSASAGRKVFGASSSKIYVAGALAHKQKGILTASQTQLMADMIVVSSNVAWVNLQTQVGGGDANKGRAYIHNLTQGLGYKLTRGFQGTWGTMHGNELVATEIVEYLHDLYKGSFVGAETVWKFMHTCRTGAARGLKYIPTSIFVGAKTGTYDGPTTNPETGSTKNPDGSAYKVLIRNHVMVFNVNGKEYGLAILGNTGSDEAVALLAGGLFQEYTGFKR